MKVKIGKVIYDSDKEPIVLSLDDKEKYQIGMMGPKQDLFLSYPETMLQIDAERFLAEYNQLMEVEYIKTPNLTGPTLKGAPDGQ